MCPPNGHWLPTPPTLSKEERERESGTGERERERGRLRINRCVQACIADTCIRPSHYRKVGREGSWDAYVEAGIAAEKGPALPFLAYFAVVVGRPECSVCIKQRVLLLLPTHVPLLPLLLTGFLLLSGARVRERLQQVIISSHAIHTHTCHGQGIALRTCAHTDIHTHEGHKGGTLRPFTPRDCLRRTTISVHQWPL